MTFDAHTAQFSHSPPLTVRTAAGERWQPLCTQLRSVATSAQAPDRSDWQPLMGIWQNRFTSAPKTP